MNLNQIRFYRSDAVRTEIFVCDHCRQDAILQGIWPGGFVGTSTPTVPEQQCVFCGSTHAELNPHHERMAAAQRQGGPRGD